MPLHGVPSLVPGSTRTKANVRGDYESERTYWCFFDPNDSDIYVIRNLPSGLQRYTADPAYAGFIVIDVEVADAAETETWGGDGVTRVRRWLVRVQYGPWTNLFNPIDGNPVNQPPIFTIESTEGEMPALVDKDGDPIVNVVGDPYDPGIVRPKTANTIVVRQNIRNPPIITMLGWADQVNVTQWKIFPPRTLLMGPISLPEPMWYQDGGFAYYPMEFKMLFNPNTWDKVVLNQGYRCFDTDQASNGTSTYKNPDESTQSITTYPLKNILIESQPAQEPVLLDITGKALFAPINQQDIVFNTHRVVGEIEFNSFPFTGVVIPSGT